MKTGYVTNHYSIVPKMVRPRKGKLERNPTFQLYAVKKVYTTNRAAMILIGEIVKTKGIDPMPAAIQLANEKSQKFHCDIDIVLMSNQRICKTVKFKG